MRERIRSRIVTRICRLLPARVARRFVRQQEGAAAVEFALVALPFLALLFAILETALVFFAGQTLEAAVTDAGRLIMTGQAQTAGFSQADFKTQVCNDLSGGLFDCAASLYVDVKTYSSFAAVNTASPITNGQFDSSKLGMDSRRAGRHRGCDVVLPMADLRIVAWQQPGQSGQRQPPAGGDICIP